MKKKTSITIVLLTILISYFLYEIFCWNIYNWTTKNLKKDVIERADIPISSLRFLTKLGNGTSQDLLLHSLSFTAKEIQDYREINRILQLKEHENLEDFTRRLIAYWCHQKKNKNWQKNVRFWHNKTVHRNSDVELSVICKS